MWRNKGSFRALRTLPPITLHKGADMLRLLLRFITVDLASLAEEIGADPHGTGGTTPSDVHVTGSLGIRSGR